MSDERRSYPDCRSVDDSLAMFGRFGPHRCPPEYLIRIYEAAMEHAPYGDKTDETFTGSEWIDLNRSS